MEDLEKSEYPEGVEYGDRTMREEIQNEALVSRLEELERRILELETSASMSESQSSSGGMNLEEPYSEPIEDFPASGELPPLAPFTIGYDLPASGSTYEGWNIYLPEGSVIVNNVIAEFKDGACAQNLSQDFADFTPATKVWCNVYDKTIGTTKKFEYKLASSKDSDADISVMIVGFDEYMTEVQKQFHIGSLILGTVGEDVNDGTLSIQGWDDPTDHEELPIYYGTFTANQAGRTEIKLPKVHDGKLIINVGDVGAQESYEFSANAKNPSPITINLSKVAKTGSYNDLKDQPNIPAPIVPPGGGGVLTFVADVQYDISTHQLQKKMGTLTVATGAVAIGNWEMMNGGQCTPHSAEHPGGVV